jgi:hypothetical protein
MNDDEETDIRATGARVNRFLIREPVFGTGEITICKTCYPMFEMTTKPLHNGDLRHGTIVGRHADVFERGVKLELVEQAIVLAGVEGAVIREFVRNEVTGAWARCRRCGHVTLVRLRYSPDVVITFPSIPDHLRQFIPECLR